MAQGPVSVSSQIGAFFRRGDVSRPLEDSTLQFHSLGMLALPSGRIVACDPLIEPDRTPFTIEAPIGAYSVSAATTSSITRSLRVVSAIVRLRETVPVRWAPAGVSNRLSSREGEKPVFCFPVGSGFAAFMDYSVASALTAELERDITYLAERVKPRIHDDQLVILNEAIDQGPAGNLLMFQIGVSNCYCPSYFGYDANGYLACLATEFVERNL